MTKLHSILEKDHLTPVDDVSLKARSQKCNKLEALQTEINQQEQNIKALKEKQRKLSEEEIPTFLQEKGLTSIRLNNGTEVSVAEDIKPGVLVDNRPFCYQWLRDNGFGDLIKNIVSVDFGMGEDEDAINLKKQIEELGLVCAEKESVHYQTLKAFVGEQHHKGVSLPDEFGVHVANVTKIVRKKKIT
jgi:hypothetical protein